MRPVALALACMGAAPAFAQLPTWNNFQVRGGAVSVGTPTTGGTQLGIVQGTQRAIVDWQGFSIGPGHAVNIAQPGASSVLLNRVTGNELSTIAGAMNANGRVFLVNPNGVLFGNGASVNVGGLVASTLKMSTSDSAFMSGTERFEFKQDGAAFGTVENRGRIAAQGGGTIALIGAQVSNSGSLVAQGGTAGLVSGDAVTVDFAGDGLTTFRVSSGLYSSVANSGLVQADGGRVVMMAAAGSELAQGVVNTRGVLRADSLASRNGEIVLDSGGSAAGVTISGGLLSAAGHGAGLAGGTVDVKGRTILLQPAAADDPGIIDASGGAGGGRIRLQAAAVGGDPQTGAIAVATGSRISADATLAGKGGDVRVMGERTLRAYGTLTARGGPNGGDGGFVETSGGFAVPAGDDNGGIDVRGARVDASAARGKAGTWLIDPVNITIASTESGGTPIFSGVFEPLSESTASVEDINATLNANTSLRISTGSAGTQAGNVTFAEGVAIQRTNPSSTAVTFQIDANQDITTESNATISSTSGPLNVLFNAGLGGTGNINFVGAMTTNGGSVALNAGVGGTGGIAHTGDFVTGGGNVSLTAGGGGDISWTGNVLTSGGSVTITGASISHTGDVLTSGGAATMAAGVGGPGGITHTGDFVTGGGNVLLTAGAGGSIVRTGDMFTSGGTITMTSGASIVQTGDIDGGEIAMSAANAISLSGDISTNGHSVTMTAGAGGGFGGIDYLGVILTGGGDLTLRATQGDTAACAICLDALVDTRVDGTNNGGTVTLIGTRGSAAPGGFFSEAVVQLTDTEIVTGTGDVTISGIGGLGGSGVEISSSEGDGGIFTTSGNIRITGVGSGFSGSSFAAGPFTTPGHGVEINDMPIQSTDGHITIRGLRLAGPSTGNGVRIAGDAGVVTTLGAGNIELTGESQDLNAGVFIAADPDFADTARVDGNHVVLRAASAGGVDALAIGGTVSAGNVLNLRPGGVDAEGNAGDHVTDPITLGSTADSGFAVSADEFTRLTAGTFVAGSNLHAGNITLFGPMSMASPLTLQNGAGGNILLAGPVNSTSTLGLISAGNITQAAGASIVAPRLLARSTGGEVLLNDPGNNVATGTVGGGAAGRFEYTDANEVTLGAVPVTAFDAASNLPQALPGTAISAHQVLVRTLSGDLSLGTDVTSTGGTDLVAAARFQNLGSYTITGAPWRVWADTWIGETRGGLAGSGPLPNLYHCAYLGLCTVSVPAGANHFIYAQQPSALVVINNTSRPGGVPNPQFTYSITGLILGDTGVGFAGAASSPATPFSLPGFYSINGSFTSAEGYAVTVVPGQLTVGGLVELIKPDVVRENQSTWLYDRNIGPAPICLATGPLGGDRAAQGGDVLAREWSRVRSRPNLTNCIDTERRNGCADF
jgi:filamentous hemagglutinin family protein